MDNLTNEMFLRLDAIAAKLGVLVEQLWDVVVWQMQVSGGVALLIAMLGSFFCYLITWRIWRAWFRITAKAQAENRKTTDNEQMLCSIPGVVFFLAGGVFFGHLLEYGVLWSTKLVNPDYHALQFFLEQIK